MAARPNIPPAVPIPRGLIPSGIDWRRIFSTGLQLAGTAALGYAAISTFGASLSVATPGITALKTKALTTASAKVPGFASTMGWLSGPTTTAKTARVAATVIGYYKTGQMVEVVIGHTAIILFQAVSLGALVRHAKLVGMPLTHEAILLELFTLIASSIGLTLNTLAATYYIILGPMSIGATAVTIESAIIAGKGTTMAMAYLVKKVKGTPRRTPRNTSPGTGVGVTQEDDNDSDSDSESDESIIDKEDYNMNTPFELSENVMGIPVPVHVPRWV
ncbi:uncharacterized protein IL334_004048 [Kwoniella shivajii]|uniref:Uncharacterized protein n=1 Tax=Kwoniella shivajii TaxID=564305 RepID=A0ABZ1D0I9_9TREE|nr:hypothetical protein IL334_004048 [Kwoniella shivajii]